MTRPGRRSEAEILAQALMHFEIAERHATRDLDDLLTIDALAQRLASGIEALSRLDADRRETTFGRTWQQMWGMRNRISHNYGMFDPEYIRQTAVHEVPTVVALLREALSP